MRNPRNSGVIGGILINGIAIPAGPTKERLDAILMSFKFVP
jgi:hypothetical protein